MDQLFWVPSDQWASGRFSLVTRSLRLGEGFVTVKLVGLGGAARGGIVDISHRAMSKKTSAPRNGFENKNKQQTA